jgi:hypothetical protein
MRIKVDFVITNEDGTEFSRNTNEWVGLSREEANFLEGMGVEFLGKLNAIGREQLAAEGKGKKK